MHLFINSFFAGNVCTCAKIKKSESTLSNRYSYRRMSVKIIPASPGKSVKNMSILESYVTAGKFTKDILK